MLKSRHELELDDDGNPLLDAPPVRCPRCAHEIDLGSLDHIDVHRCSYCRSRTRYLWSDRRGMPVPEIRGRNPDWIDPFWDGTENDFDLEFESDDDDCEDPGCVHGCIDPIFDAPAELFFDGLDWRCPVCGEK